MFIDKSKRGFWIRDKTIINQLVNNTLLLLHIKNVSSSQKSQQGKNLVVQKLIIIFWKSDFNCLFSAKNLITIYKFSLITFFSFSLQLIFGHTNEELD